MTDDVICNLSESDLGSHPFVRVLPNRFKLNELGIRFRSLALDCKYSHYESEDKDLLRSNITTDTCHNNKSISPHSTLSMTSLFLSSSKINITRRRRQERAMALALALADKCHNITAPQKQKSINTKNAHKNSS